MRITRDTLLRIARDTVDGAIHQNHSIIAVYLSGSLLEDDFQLGGTVDIDLFFIHTDEIEEEREIVSVTEDIHLDIAHHRYRDYQQTRNLRIHPWFGPVLCNAIVMHDPQHFLDFTQASVRGQFDRADYIYQRILVQLERSRKIWFDLQLLGNEPGIEEVFLYIKAISLIANAIASYSNAPLTERRFLIDLPERAQAIGQPGLYHGFLGLLGAPKLEQTMLKEWLSSWRVSYLAVPEDKRPARLDSTRLRYYEGALESMLETERYEAILYPLLHTWLISAMNLPDESTSKKECLKALETLGLKGKGFEERILALDAYLDVVEEIVENWAKENGVWLSG